MEIEKELEIYTKALYLAVEQLTDAKEMLRSVGEKDLAGVLDDSADYFLRKARYEIEKEMRAKNDN